MPKKPTLKAAREAAMRGDADAAIAGITPFADAGDTSASASLAEIYAFKNEWPQVITHAARLVCDSSTVSAANVFDDCVRLLGRAGRETNAWSEIAAAITKPKTKAERERTILAGLTKYCERKGKPPHELVALWANPETPEAERRAHYADAVARVFEIKPKLKTNPDGLKRHIFALADVYRLDDEIVRLYPDREALLSFDQMCSYARAADPTAAWAAIERKVHDFFPVDRAQVAPVVLLYDETIAPLVTAERALKILGTPRGKQAKR